MVSGSVAETTVERQRKFERPLQDSVTPCFVFVFCFPSPDFPSCSHTQTPGGVRNFVFQGTVAGLDTVQPVLAGWERNLEEKGGLGMATDLALTQALLCAWYVP